MHRSADEDWHGSEIPAAVAKVLGSAGHPLEGSTRARMESRLGHDFGHVRVHSDTEAAASAEMLHAHAYTLGRHIVMGHRRYQPHNLPGQRLLAHELTHVVQQGNPSVDTVPARGVSSPGDPSERTAERFASTLAEPGWSGDIRPSIAPSDRIHRQGEGDDFGGGQFGGAGAGGSWEPAQAADNVTLVEVSCDSPSSGAIDFHLTDGAVMRYQLTVCELTPGEYTADVAVRGHDLMLTLDAPPGLLFRFNYAIDPGQPDPSTFFGGQRRVPVRAMAGVPPLPPTPTPSPGPSPVPTGMLPIVCSRPLDFPWWTGLRGFRHAYINDPPANYAIRGLVSGNGVTKSCSTATDASGPPDEPATSTCKPCRPAPGQTVADVSACLRRTHAAYPSPNLYRNLPDPADGWRHGPNSNSYAAAMARCCHDFSPAGLGLLPGWNHSPAGPCTIPMTVGEPSPSDEPAQEPPRDAGVPIAGVPADETGASTGSDTAPTDLHAFGNRTKPRDPRLNTDIDPNPDGTVGPEPKNPPWPAGASTFGDPSKAPLTGHYHRILSGTRMATGLRVIPDGSEVGGPHGETHHMIFPAERMPFQDFVDKFQGLGWGYAGKK